MIRKLKLHPIVRKVTLCRGVCIRPCMSCFRCIAILPRIIGLKSYHSHSLIAGPFSVGVTHLCKTKSLRGWVGLTRESWVLC